MSVLGDKITKEVAEKVYEQFGKKIVEEQKNYMNQKNKEMEKILSNFLDTVKEVSNKVIKSEFDSEIRRIVQEELEKFVMEVRKNEIKSKR